MLDSLTPREVWLEYEARKRELPRALTPAVYELAVSRIARELGLDRPRSALTAAQRDAQRAAVRRRCGR